MKIDRNKLNTLLRSGLNPEIKTRKQLAAHLSLDPTSLTRWFASRDRLGNPRYPVVPDRHVTKILQLFKLDPKSLALNDEEFRHYCFENSLTKSNHQSDLEQKKRLRQEYALQRKLKITDYSSNKSKKPLPMLFSLVLLFVAAWYLAHHFHFNNLKAITSENHITTPNLHCWTGYSPSLGVFAEEDKADPCHYGKLFHNALMQLKAENKQLNSSLSKTELSGNQAYITFLFKQLEYRRIRDSITLNIELGKNEMHRSNYQAAQSYFHNASQMLTALPEPNPQMSTEISIYAAKIANALH
ncbi:hypothetical protein [Thalassomonas haliotis]|uniref:HTH cro/C1-type domain-containing protein n=1 Tax=Thalassomonas haliotis TaxID=485448 RepID=A0ABY7VHQ3_9GAMM|nr:hypothetical protein [Thalassomonas haliotis]WDE12192.1 hypothetical protein H3N35_01515 [Thalassomonas haliotis]